jgi:hypothetical protein
MPQTQASSRKYMRPLDSKLTELPDNEVIETEQQILESDLLHTLKYQFSNSLTYHHTDFFFQPTPINSLQNKEKLNQLLDEFNQTIKYFSSTFKYEYNPNEITLENLQKIIKLVNDLQLMTVVLEDICYIEYFYLGANYIFESYIFSILFLSLLILSAQVFTFKNLILSSILTFVGFFILTFLLYSQLDILQQIRAQLSEIFSNLSLIVGFELDNYYHNRFFMIWFTPILLIIALPILWVFIFSKQGFLKWIILLMNFLWLSSFFLTAFAIFFLNFVSQRTGCIPDGPNPLVRQIIFIYPILALAMFGMYALYNQIAIFPQKK